jgi:hypothetical protein
MEHLLPNPHPPGCPWHQAAEKFGAPNLKWCEESICGWITEPANTWSNLAYFVAAVVLFIWSRKSNHKSVRYLPYAMFIMGAGSYVYHMSNNYLSQIFDFVGMYVFVYWLAVMNMLRLKWVKDLKQAIMAYAGFIVLNTVLLHIMYLMGIKFQLLIVVAGVFIVTLEYLANSRSEQKVNYKYLVSAIIVIIIAETFSILDINRIVCNPTNHWFQGHATWHLLSAIGLTIGYKHWEQFEYDE